MKKEEFEKLELTKEEKLKVITVSDLINKKDRTLLYGYTCTRETFHVYLKTMKIHVVIYQNYYGCGIAKPKNMREIIVESNIDYIPDKRLYPEACDFEFCKLLKEKDFHLPFTNFNNDRETNIFYGFTLENK